MKKAFFAASLYLLPLMVAAQSSFDESGFESAYGSGGGGGGGLGGLIAGVGNLLNMLIPVLIAAAVVVFFWGLVQYIRTHKGGKDTMIAGFIGLFIMVSVWGIIRIAQSTIGDVGNAGKESWLRGSVPQIPLSR